jgi:TRAP-type C4-dicarboxylate transport system substrate-binding protein
MVGGADDDKLAKLINDGTNGRVKINMYHSESLGKISDYLTLLEGGVVNIALINTGYYPGQFAIEPGLELPLLGFSTREQRSQLTWDLYNKGYLKGLNNYKVISFNPIPFTTVFLKKKVQTLTDFNGLKIRATDVSVRNLLELAGASPISMPGGELYMGIDRGIIDGVVTADESFLSYKLFEVAKYAMYEPKLGSGCNVVIMAKDSWNSLPADLQAQVNKIIESYKTQYLQAGQEQDKLSPETMKKQGMDVYSLSPEETAKLKALAATIKEKWIATQEANGLPAKEMMSLVDKYLAQK